MRGQAFTCDDLSNISRVSDRKITVSEQPTSQSIKAICAPSASDAPTKPTFVEVQARRASGKRFSYGGIPDAATFSQALKSPTKSTSSGQLLSFRTSSALIVEEVSNNKARKLLRRASTGQPGVAASVEAPVRSRLRARRCQRQQMSPETLQRITDAIAEHSVSLFLEEADVDMIVDAMEYFVFKAGEVVIEEGEAETHLMVSLDASIKVDKDGYSNELPCGAAFGSCSLLYEGARTSTVKTMEDCGIWGADGAKFRQRLRTTANRRSMDNMRLLEKIDLFNLFSARQRDLVSRVLLVEHVRKDGLVVEKGACAKAAAAIYRSESPELPMSASRTRRLSDLAEEATLWCVKEGKLRAEDPDTGIKICDFQVGDCFGERGLLYQEGSPYTVIAEEDSELLCICNSRLKPLLGTDVTDFLWDHIINSALCRGPVCANYSPAQRESIAREFRSMNLSPQEPLVVIGEGKLIFVVVITGAIEGTSDERDNTGGSDEPPVKFTRGQFYSFLGQQWDVSITGQIRLTNFVAGADGASLGVLTQDGLWRSLGYGKDKDDEVQAYTQVLMALKKVPIFRHLSQDQISNLASSFVQESKGKGEYVIEQGSRGGTFYVVAKGEVSITISGKLIRTMAKNAYFGERALIFDEPRTASVQVSSDAGAELWSVDKTAFDSVITENMRQELMRRIRLQDTQAKLGDLKIVRAIGRGASGVVRLVEHRKTHTRYALKYCEKQNDAMLKEIRRECDLLRENDHPFIMNVVTTYETMRRIYMLTELLTGGDLHGAIRQIPHCLTRSQASFYTASLVIVLEALWDRNIVFRDLKPENVMIDMQGYIKLIDFGVSKKVGADGLTFTTIGTPHYMAPEVLVSKGYSCGCDLWSLGVMLFEFVIGCLPFGNEESEPGQIFKKVLAAKLWFPDKYKDEAGRELIQGLLHVDPAERLGTSMRGYEDVRRARFFLPKGSNDHELLFNQIMGRELVAPHVPQEEVFNSDSEDDFSDQESNVTDVSDELQEGDQSAQIRPLASKWSLGSAFSMRGSRSLRSGRCCGACFSFLHVKSE